MTDRALEDLTKEEQLALLESGELDDALVIRLIQLLDAGAIGSEAPQFSADDFKSPSPSERPLAEHGLDLVERARRVTLDKAQTETARADRDTTPDQYRGADAESITLTDQLPQRIGKFEIVRELGRGGFGLVLLAKDPQLQRFVALKIPKAEALLSGESRQRFEREAQSAAILSHPAIIPIYESGHVGPLSYIAFAYCDGPTLGKWFADRDGRIDPHEAARIVRRLAEAVQHAHSRGIIHRDLKPGNVLLDFGAAREGSSLKSVESAVQIADFGLARVAGDDAEKLTKTGALIGTPAFMAPEQARGEPDIGEASDIYALGAILYYLLSGQPPIRRESDLATLRAVETETPRSLRGQEPHVPRDLDAICLKCLEKKAADRYPSAHALEADLQGFLAGDPVTARPISHLSRTARWCQNNPVVATVTAMFILALIAGATASTIFWASASRQAEEALTQTRMARTAVDDLLRAIADEPNLKSKGMESFRQKLLVSANNYYQLVSTHQPDDRHVLREYIDTLKGLANLHGQLGDNRKAEEIWDRAVRLLEDEFPDERQAASAMRIAQSENFNTLGQHQDAVTAAAIAVEHLKGAEAGAEAVHKNLVSAMVQLARTLSSQGKIMDAEHAIDEAIDIVNTRTGISPGEWPADRIWGKVLRTKCDIAARLLKAQDLDKFAPLTSRIYAELMDDPEHAPESLDAMARMEGLLGTSLNYRKDLEKALVHLQAEGALVERIVELRPEAASNHARLANQKFRLARCLFDSGKAEEAQQAMLGYLPKLHQSVERYPDLNALAMTNVLVQQLLSKTYRAQNDMATATEELAKAIMICESVCQSPQASVNSRMILSTLYMEQSTFYLQQRLLDEAGRECERGMAILEELFEQEPAGETVGQLEFAYNLFGNIMNKLGRFEEFLTATDHLDQWPRSNSNVRQARQHRVGALIGAGRLEEARQSFQRLSETHSSEQDSLNLAGLASRSAGLVSKAGRDSSADHNFFLTESVRFLESARDFGMMSDPSVVKLLHEHEDFAAVRKTDDFSEIVPDLEPDI